MFRAMAAAFILTMAGAIMAAAQGSGPFAPRLIVNNEAITNYELEQRIRFIRLLGNPPDAETLALEGLIEDRLRDGEAKRLGLTVSEEELADGMADFAGRANLPVDEFIAAIGQAGVAPETFRDFVKSGLVWRKAVRARFGPRAQVTEAEIDRAVANASGSGGAPGAQVLLSEIVLRADTLEYRAEAMDIAERLARTVRSEGAFAAAARQYSAADSAAQGGRMSWMPLSRLPAPIATQILTLGPGEVTDPVELPNAVVLFQLRAIREAGAAAPKTVSVEYARFFIPGGSMADALKVRGQVDTCDDLYGVAKGLPEDRLQREVKPVDEVPAPIAREIEKLDEGEISYGLSTPQMAVVLMLCGRTPDLGDAEIDREAIRRQLLNQRLGGYATSYLAELRADAIIREP